LSANYRVNQFGFLALNELAAEANGTTGNYALQDQTCVRSSSVPAWVLPCWVSSPCRCVIVVVFSLRRAACRLALNWVQANIRQFGGDPSK
jgi:hypothetical protein